MRFILSTEQQNQEALNAQASFKNYELKLDDYIVTIKQNGKLKNSFIVKVYVNEMTVYNGLLTTAELEMFNPLFFANLCHQLVTKYPVQPELPTATPEEAFGQLRVDDEAAKAEAELATKDQEEEMGTWVRPDAGKAQPEVVEQPKAKKEKAAKVEGERTRVVQGVLVVNLETKEAAEYKNATEAGKATEVSPTMVRQYAAAEKEVRGFKWSFVK